MQAQFAVLADAANSTASGKLNILGIFDRITTHEFPTSLPTCVLVCRLKLAASESGADLSLRIIQVDGDGRELCRIEGVVPTERIEGRPEGHADLIIPLSSAGVPLPIPSEGDYQFGVLMGGSMVASARFSARLVQEQPLLN